MCVCMHIYIYIHVAKQVSRSVALVEWFNGLGSA